MITEKASVCATKKYFFHDANDRTNSGGWLCSLINIGIHTVEIGWSNNDCLISIIGIPVLVRWHFYIKSGLPQWVSDRWHPGPRVTHQGVLSEEFCRWLPWLIVLNFLPVKCRIPAQRDPCCDVPNTTKHGHHLEATWQSSCRLSNVNKAIYKQLR